MTRSDYAGEGVVRYERQAVGMLGVRLFGVYNFDSKKNDKIITDLINELKAYAEQNKRQFDSTYRRNTFINNRINSATFYLTQNSDVQCNVSSLPSNRKNNASGRLEIELTVGAESNMPPEEIDGLMSIIEKNKFVRLND